MDDFRKEAKGVINGRIAMSATCPLCPQPSVGDENSHSGQT